MTRGILSEALGLNGCGEYDKCSEAQGNVGDDVMMMMLRRS